MDELSGYLSPFALVGRREGVARCGRVPARVSPVDLATRISKGGRMPAGYAARVGCKTYLNGPGERSQSARSDLNVPLRLECELIGAGRWSHAIAG
jgi:hypothetical protein